LSGLLARGRDRAVKDCLLASKLAGPPERFAFLAHCLLGGLFIKASSLHFAKDTFPLHLLLQDAESLFDVVVAYENLQFKFLFLGGESSGSAVKAWLVQHVRGTHPVVAARTAKPSMMD
jgi:hypothetical protein